MMGLEDMTTFDVVVGGIVGIAGIGGLLRGFVREILSLLAWALALFAISTLHTDLTGYLQNYIESQTNASVLAFMLLLLVPYFAMKLIARMAGAVTGKSVLGPVDKLLGLGFGLVKGLIIAVLGFSVLALGYDTVWGVAGRPAWITNGVSYPLINASSDQLVELLAERRRELAKRDAAQHNGEQSQP